MSLVYVVRAIHWIRSDRRQIPAHSPQDLHIELGAGREVGAGRMLGGGSWEGAGRRAWEGAGRIPVGILKKNLWGSYRNPIGILWESYRNPIEIL